MRIARILLAVVMVLAGLNHFLNPEVYVAIMPEYLPWHRGLVLWSGVFEVLGGLGLLSMRTRRPAALGLALLLVAVYPANFEMYRLDLPFGSWHAPRSMHLLRLATQVGLVLLCLAIARASSSEAMAD